MEIQRLLHATNCFEQDQSTGSGYDPSEIQLDLRHNFTANLLRNWLAPGGEKCREAKTVGKDSVELTAGKIHEFRFQSLDDSGKPVCIGGDYLETDLSGENWKWRPPVKDLGNGTYSLSLEIHPDFAGDYNLTVVLLFRHFQGLKFNRELQLQQPVPARRKGKPNKSTILSKRSYNKVQNDKGVVYQVSL